jgi:hypothetical protein
MTVSRFADRGSKRGRHAMEAPKSHLSAIGVGLQRREFLSSCTTQFIEEPEKRSRTSVRMAGSEISLSAWTTRRIPAFAVFGKTAAAIWRYSDGL